MYRCSGLLSIEIQQAIEEYLIGISINEYYHMRFQTTLSHHLKYSLTNSLSQSISSNISNIYSPTETSSAVAFFYTLATLLGLRLRKSATPSSDGIPNFIFVGSKYLIKYGEWLVISTLVSPANCTIAVNRFCKSLG